MPENLLKTRYKPRTGGALAKVAYLLKCKSLDLARFLLISERARIGRVTPVGPELFNAMKSILTLIIVGALCVTGQASTNAVLRGIRIVETQDQLHPPRGKLGERGPYQFRHSTWRMHTSSSFDLSENREVANTVAKRHYAWIETQLLANGIEASTYNIALAWNAGVNAVIRGNAPAVAHDYATRVLNIASTSAIPDETPQPAWQAPTLVTVEKPNLPPAPEVIPTPTPVVAPAMEVVSIKTSEQNKTLEVRYYGNPILLALNRTIPPDPIKETLPVPLEIASNTLLAADFPKTFVRM